MVHSWRQEMTARVGLDQFLSGKCGHHGQDIPVFLF